MLMLSLILRIILYTLFRFHLLIFKLIIIFPIVMMISYFSFIYFFSKYIDRKWQTKYTYVHAMNGLMGSTVQPMNPILCNRDNSTIET